MNKMYQRAPASPEPSGASVKATIDRKQRRTPRAHIRKHFAISVSVVPDVSVCCDVLLALVSQVATYRSDLLHLLYFKQAELQAVCQAQVNGGRAAFMSSGKCLQSVGCTY